MSKTAEQAEQAGHTNGMRRRRWPWVLLAVVLTLAGLVLALPYGLKFGAEYALRKLGAEQASIERVRLSLWRGELGVEGLYLEDSGHPPLSLRELHLRVAYRPLFERRILVEELRVEGLQAVLALTPGQMPHIGIQVPEPKPAAEPSEPAEPWGFALGSAALRDVDFRARLPEFEGRWQVERLQLADLTSWLPMQASQLSLQSRFNGARVDLDGDSQVFDPSRETNLQIAIKALPLAAFQGFVADALPRLAGELSLDMNVGLRLQDGELSVLPRGRLQLSGLDLADASGHALQLGLDWNGAVQLRQALQAGTMALSAEGALQLADLHADLAPQRLVADAGQLGWKGKVDVALDGEAPQVAAAGDVQLASIRLTDSARNLLLLTLGEGSVGELAYAGPQSVRVGSVALAGVAGLARAARPKLRMVALDRVAVSRLALSDAGLEIADIALDGGLTRLYLRPDRQLEYVTDLLAPVADPVPASPAGGAAGNAGADESVAASADAAPMRVRIDRLRVTRPHRIDFRDAGTEPAFGTELRIEELSVTNLDTADATARSALKLTAGIGEFGSLQAVGGLRPLVDPQDADLDIELRAINLPPLTPYAVQAIGYELDNGQLDIETGIKMRARELDGNNRIFVRDLQLTKQDATRAEQFASTISMPLNSALSLLRDGDGNIELDIPVSGRADRPDISVQDAINQALGTAVKKAAFSYVKYAIQPYGALITLAEVATEAGRKMALKLQPVRFAPGQAELDQTGRDYLLKLAGLLAERPEITLKLCASAVANDRAALATRTSEGEETGPAGNAGGASSGSLELIDIEARMRDLAGARMSAVKGLLVTERGVDAGRLLTCNPRIDEDLDAEPEVQINI